MYMYIITCALTYAMTVCNKCVNSPSVKTQQRILIGDAFASFLPGITIGLSKVITGDYKQGHIVICVSIDILYIHLQCIAILGWPLYHHTPC